MNNQTDNYLYTVIFKGDFMDRERIFSEMERVFKKIKRKKCLIKGDVTISVDQMRGGCASKILNIGNN